MARRARPVLAATSRAAAVTLAVMLVTAMATGWLYWLRARVAHWPGPHVRDVLPLDELAGHDSIPLIVFAMVFGIAAAILGLVARAARLDRLAAGLGLAVGVGAWLFIADAISLFLVRQVPAGHAFRAAAGLQPIYLAAALAGVGGALLGRATRSDRIAPRLMSWLVAAGGLIDLMSALVPRRGAALGLVERFGPGLVVPAAHALLAPTGVLLLIGSRGLARRSKRAWALCVALLGLSAALSLLRGPDYATAIVTGFIAVALVAQRQQFPFRGDPAAEPPALLRLAGMVVAAIAYGVVTLFAYQTVADLPFSLPGALLDSIRALAGLAPRGSQYLPGGFSRWFPASVLCIAAIGVIWAAGVWVRPWRQRLFPGTGSQEQAEDIVRRWGADTLAPFTLRLDKQWFFTGQSLIAYRVVRGVAVVSGDPVGPPDEAGAAVGAFLSHARSRGWHVGVLGASGRFLDSYRQHGLYPVYHGDEAVIDTAAFCLDGRPMRAIRQAAHRLERHGYQAEVVMAGDVPPDLRAELAAIDSAWLHGGIRKGFTMELDDPFRLRDGDALFVIGRDCDGRVAGFLHLAVCRPSRSLSLSSMPRRADTPNGFNAWLIISATAWAREAGFARISLNFSPFAGLLATDAALTSAQRLERRALLRCKDILALQLDNLLRFNRQFSPAWLPRYVIVEHRADLPRVALAAMAAEGYLPRAGLIRGRGWSPPGRPLPESPSAEQPPHDTPPAGHPAQHEPSGGRR
ncbi:MAG TPA: phosphatidylglycerol lysyltransferase domain-containing protein [Streptosporangiaceae bacterium]|nr:phosphatidylglycerol lysyltransferase domain-containing protein [Streptosporangiaceae bacterium]